MAHGSASAVGDLQCVCNGYWQCVGNGIWQREWQWQWDQVSQCIKFAKQMPFFNNVGVPMMFVEGSTRVQTIARDKETLGVGRWPIINGSAKAMLRGIRNLANRDPFLHGGLG